MRTFVSSRPVRALLLAVATCLGLLASTALAQGFPNKPLKLIVPYTAGGSSDFVGRTLAQKMGEGLGQPFVVENRPGVAGIAGTEAVAHAAADGYTVALIGMTTHGANPSLYKKLPYDALKDFVPIGNAAVSPLVLVVPPSLPVNNVQELIAYAKANPGKLNFGSAGIGNTLHLGGELFKSRAGIDAVHVPYNL